jgi:hypothetical protein
LEGEGCCCLLVEELILWPHIHDDRRTRLQACKRRRSQEQPRAAKSIRTWPDAS